MISVAEWDQGGRLVGQPGERIFCREGGPAGAPVLVLIHGFPTSSWDYEALWAPLTARYRVITLDMQGFGFSDKPDRPYTIAAQADLFERRLEALGVDEYHVLAHDYGDTVAQELLARQPAARARLRSVCFLNGGLFPETHRPLLIQTLLLSPLGAFVARLTSRARFEANLLGIFGAATPPSPDFLEGAWQLLTHADGIPAMARLIHYMEERVTQRERWVGALKRGEVPLKLIDGADDPVSGRHMADRYRELVPSADVTLLEGIGHYPQVEASQAVLEAYLQFRARV
jgi:pimeloyl-ACP methyl ester carboxylesterase